MLEVVVWQKGRENGDWKLVGRRWMAIQTLKNQPGHVRDIRVVMNHVRVVCPILLGRKQFIIRFYFVLKVLFNNIITIVATHFTPVMFPLHQSMTLRKVMKCTFYKSDNNRYVFTLWGREKLLNSPD